MCVCVCVREREREAREDRNDGRHHTFAACRLLLSKSRDAVSMASDAFSATESCNTCSCSSVSASSSPSLSLGESGKEEEFGNNPMANIRDTKPREAHLHNVHEELGVCARLVLADGNSAQLEEIDAAREWVLECVKGCVHVCRGLGGLWER